MMESKQYFTTLDEVSEYTGIPAPMLRRMQTTGRFPVEAKPANPQMVYHRADVDAWLAAGRPYAGLGRLRGF